MKKRFGGMIILLVCVLLVGCTKVEKGDYNEGTYMGVDDATKTVAAIYINENGIIKSVFIDVAYSTKDNTGATIATTKQILRNAYGMKGKGSPVAQYEWYEQANKLADKVVKEQGLDWLTLKYRVVGTDGKATFTDTKPTNQTESNKSYTDAVSGVTIQVNGMYKALDNALTHAIKYKHIKE